MPADSGSLIPGHSFGPYQIVGALGAGGMGEVFQATDTRLGREVALKVIPDAMAADVERMARFEREARVLASLNHPNIAGLYGIEEADGRKALVMELVPGEDLTKRIDAGALPLEDALGIALQIARGLEAAHLKGVVHRDLKPANVRLTPDGQVKVLDFGLAKPTSADASSSQVDVHLSQSPTIANAATQAGVILGTAAYMSPEQARGRNVDARTDVFSFGCVLFEMLSGTRTFAGEDISEILASVIKGDVPWSRLPADLPAPVLALLRRCLATRADERYQAIGDVRYDLARFVADPSTLAPAPASPAAAAGRSRAGLVPLAIAGLGLVAAAIFAGLYFPRPQPHRQTVRFEIEPAPGVRTFLWPRLSPDGETLAFLMSDSTGARRIYIRHLDEASATPLEGTESAGRPFWSPDGRSLAFMVGEKLKKISAGGGAIQLIADASGRFDGSWGGDGTILLDGGPGDSILAVSASGGAVRPATRFDLARGEVGHAWPSFLPDGKRFLYTADTAAGQLDLIRLGKLGSFETTIVDSCDSRVEYVAPGYLLYAREATLFARRFDLAAGKCLGEAFPIAENLGNLSNSGDFSGSLTGSIAYRARAGESKDQIVVVDRAGKVLETIEGQANYGEIALSPDDTRLAFARSDEAGNADIWVRDLRRGTTSRLTFDNASDVWPVWSPDGTQIAWASARGGPHRIFIKLASGVGAERMVKGQEGVAHGAVSWNAALDRLLVSFVSPAGSWDLKTLSPGDSTVAAGVVGDGPFDEFDARFSPDGRWVAVQSSESTRPEIYVQSYPVPSSRWQISANGARNPEWRADGRELFFRTLVGDTMMAVPILPGTSFEWGTAQPLFAVGATTAPLTISQWKPTSDGQRFFIVRQLEQGNVAPISVVVDWAAEVERQQGRK